MNPPRHLIEQFLKDGDRGVLTSSLCLAAALAVKHGLDVKGSRLMNPGTGDVIEGEALERALADTVELFRRGTPQQIDAAIALYSAHLRAAGYEVDFGRDN